LGIAFRSFSEKLSGLGIEAGDSFVLSRLAVRRLFPDSTGSKTTRVRASNNRAKSGLYLKYLKSPLQMEQRKIVNFNWNAPILLEGFTELA
jgi:hypothetical protein